MLDVKKEIRHVVISRAVARRRSQRESWPPASGLAFLGGLDQQERACHDGLRFGHLHQVSSGQSPLPYRNIEQFYGDYQLLRSK